jgi:hypothetical protein
MKGVAVDTDTCEKYDKVGKALVAVQSADTAYLEWKVAQTKADNMRRIYHQARAEMERLTGQWGPLWATQGGDEDAEVDIEAAPDSEATTMVRAPRHRDDGGHGQDVGELA